MVCHEFTATQSSSKLKAYGDPPRLQYDMDFCKKAANWKKCGCITHSLILIYDAVIIMYRGGVLPTAGQNRPLTIWAQNIITVLFILSNIFSQLLWLGLLRILSKGISLLSPRGISAKFEKRFPHNSLKGPIVHLFSFQAGVEQPRIIHYTKSLSRSSTQQHL